MPSPRRSNCHLWAWREFISGRAEWLAYRHTEYSALSHYATRWWWRWTLTPVGVVLQWAGYWTAALGWLLRWGSWYHMVWITPDEQWWEYVPELRKRPRHIPPIIFRGRPQQVEDTHNGRQD